MGALFEEIVVDAEGNVLYNYMEVFSREPVCGMHGNFFRFGSVRHVIDEEREQMKGEVQGE